MSKLTGGAELSNGPTALTPPKRTADRRTVAEQPAPRGPEHALVAAPMGTQAARLADPAVPVAQRQRIAQHLGRAHGNAHLNKVLAAVARGPGLPPGARQRGVAPARSVTPSHSALAPVAARALRAGAVASAALEHLRAGAAEARTVIAGAPTRPGAEPKSRGSGLLVGALEQSTQQGLDQLGAATQASILATADVSDRQVHALDAAEAAAAHGVQRQVRGAHEHVSVAADQHRTAITQAHAVQQQALADWHAGSAVRAAQEVGRRQETVTQIGFEHATQMRASGDRAGAAAQAGLSAASAEARSQSGGGGGDAGKGHAQVASRLGGDAATQFASAAGEVPGQLTAHASDAAAEYEAHMGEAASAVGGHLAALQTGLAQTVEGAATAVGDLAHQSMASLQGGADQAASELDSAEGQVLETLRSRAGAQRDAMVGAGSRTAAGIRRAAETAAALARRQLAADAERIADTHIDEAAAAQALPALRAQVTAAFDGTAAQAMQVGGDVATHLAAAGQDAHAVIARAALAVAPSMANASQVVGAALGRGSAQAEGAMTHAANATKAGANQALAASGQHFDGAVAQARSGSAQAATAVSASVDQALAESGRLRSSAETDLHGRIAEGQQRVDSFVASRGPVIQRSVLGAIGHWFAGQFNDLLEMLGSAGFWVGLVVTIILLPVMGPGALVVGGLAGGIAGGIQQNIKQGRDWYDYRNILRGAFIGALAGAAMAFGVGVIIGLGWEGAAAVAAVMVLSAGIGIVVNFATGQRWDKGLLANLFLAWLFQRVFGGSPEKPTEIEPQPGGRTTTEVPGLRGAIDPAHPPDGWIMSDLVTQVGSERVVTTEVTAPDGSTGQVQRGFDPQTGETVLHYAFLDRIPAPLRWVATDPAMVQGRGTPLETYLTLRQMRILEAKTGTPTAITSPRIVRISTIVNVRTIAKLAQQVRANVPADQAIINTHSVQYANNSIVQSGGRIVSAHVDGGNMVPAESVLTPESMAEHGLSLGDQVLYFFDIFINVEPATGGSRPLSGVPPPVPGHDDSDGGLDAP